MSDRARKRQNKQQPQVTPSWGLANPPAPIWGNEQLFPLTMPQQIPYTMMESSPQRNFLPENLAALRNDPQGDRNKAYMPGDMNPSGANPFANGMFQSAASRLGDMTNKTGAYAPADPFAREATMQQMLRAGVLQPPQQARPEPALLPFTQALTAPTPQNPGFGSAQYPGYEQALLAQQKRTLAAARSPFAY